MTDMTKINTLWKTLAAKKHITKYDIIAMALIKALNAKSNDKLGVAKGLLLKAFTPITNKNRLYNGAEPFESVIRELYYNRPVISILFSALNDDEKQPFIDLMKTLSKETWVDNTYAYILVRSDIPPIHQLVQAAHTTMLLGQRTKHDANKLHFCILDGGSEEDLKNFGSKILYRNNIKFVTFWEPDANKLWNGLQRKEITGLACYPMRKSYADKRRLFTDKKLLSI